MSKLSGDVSRLRQISPKVLTAPFSERSELQIWQQAPWSYCLATVGIAVMTAIIAVSHIYTRLANVSMLYLLVVIFSALYLGRYPAIFTSLLAFGVFSLFVKFKYSHDIDTVSEIIALCVFLLSATVTGQLTLLLKMRADEAERRRRETQILAEASWAVVAEIDQERLLKKVLRLILNIPSVKSVMLHLCEDNNNYQAFAHVRATTSGEADISVPDRDVVEAAGLTLSNLSVAMNGWMHLPVTLDEEALGILSIEHHLGEDLSPDERRLVDSFLNHIAVVIQREKLLKAQAKAEALAEANTLKTALLSMVSHDFRSPLTSIKASVSTLMEDGPPMPSEDQRALLQTVDSETDRLNRLVGNILDMSKLESGFWKPRCESISMSEVISSTLSSFSDDDNERIKLEIDIREPEAWLDAVQIEQVLRNLLENALKYSPEGTDVTLSVRQDGGAVHVDVRDCGSGLPKGEEERIFERFYRAAGLGESSTPGLGLGLAVCKGLVESHGGKLQAKNHPQGGAVFSCFIPPNPADQGVRHERQSASR